MGGHCPPEVMLSGSYPMVHFITRTLTSPPTGSTTTSRRAALASSERSPMPAQPCRSCVVVPHSAFGKPGLGARPGTNVGLRFSQARLGDHERRRARLRPDHEGGRRPAEHDQSADPASAGDCQQTNSATLSVWATWSKRASAKRKTIGVSPVPRLCRLAHPGVSRPMPGKAIGPGQSGPVALT
jgi:hypothetical protein